jgi:hypothetical protein
LLRRGLIGGAGWRTIRSAQEEAVDVSSHFQGGAMGAINHVAVWVAGIVHFILGACWYTVFGNAWMAAIGKTEAQVKSDQPNMAIPLAIAVVVAVIIAYTLAWLIPKLGASSAAGGAKTGATLALALIAPTMAMNYGFEARSISLWLINSGYMVVGMAIMGAILGGWKKRA